MTAVEVEAAPHTSAPSAPRTRLPLRTVAIMLLTVSAATRLLWTSLSANGLNLVDLRVYVDGSAALADNQLYEFSTSFGSPDFALPFTYPPFAALLFYPLHHLPFTVVGLAWQVATIGAMYLVVRISFELIDSALDDTAKGDKRPDRRNATMIWCAVALWTEPVRTTLECGQVNVFIVAAVLAAARSARWWISGALVGLVAGVKLTPAISGLYFPAQAASGDRRVVGGRVRRDDRPEFRPHRQPVTRLLHESDRRRNQDRSSRVGRESVAARGVEPVGRIRRRDWSGVARRGVGRGCPCRVGLARARCLGRARCVARRAVPRVGRLADLVGAPLGVGDAVAHLAELRTAAASTRRASAGLVLVCRHSSGSSVGIDPGSALGVGHLTPWCSGLARCGERDRRGSVVRLARRDPMVRCAQPSAIRSIARASATSSSVSPPSECVDSVNVTLRQRISISG